MSHKRKKGALESEEQDSLNTLLVLTYFLWSQQPHPRLLRVESAALRNVIAQQDDLGYIKFIRLDRHLFAALLPRFARLYENRHLRLCETSGIAGAPQVARRALPTNEALFLALRFLAGAGSVSDLSVEAGIAPATFVRTTRAALIALLVALRHWRLARVCAPTNQEAEELSWRVSNRLPRLRHFIAFADGELRAMENPSDWDLQNAYYNGKDRIAAIKVQH